MSPECDWTPIKVWAPDSHSRGFVVPSIITWWYTLSDPGGAVRASAALGARALEGDRHAERAALVDSSRVE